MDSKVKGAWLLHHARKLQTTYNQDFDSISFSGKCGILLSAISGESQAQIGQARLEALARANSLSPKAELPSILTELERQKLILRGAGGMEVLGLTGHSVLEHTASIYAETPHEMYEDAVIDISEIASETPTTDKSVSERIGDAYGLTKDQVLNTIQLGTNIGFFDAEQLSTSEHLLFNGNLFRRDEANKINAVVSSLGAAEMQALNEANAKLNAAGCLPLNIVETILGRELFARLHSIGFFDVSTVGNDQGKNHFVTRPAAFSKFTNSIADDALDLAKALVAALTYGMTVSSYYRGRIQMVSKLVGKLIAGGTVGPATAIGSDYQALEYKGVIAVQPCDGGMFTMRLLKPEVGRLALAVIENGDITAEAVATIPGAKVTEYVSPETTREIRRRGSSEAVKLKAKNLLQEIRMGGLAL